MKVNILNNQPQALGSMGISKELILDEIYKRKCKEIYMVMTEQEKIERDTLVNYTKNSSC